MSGLGACRAWGVDSENRPQRGQFSPDLQPHSPAMGQKDGGKWTAAVDLEPTFPKSDRLLRYQAIQVGHDAQASSLENALSEASSFGLKLLAAKAIVQEIAHVVDGWREHFKACGVSASDLDMLEQYLDNGPLGSQRKELLVGRVHG